MLCLTTRWVPWTDENPQDRLRTILDLNIPGILLSSEDPLDQWALLVREIQGARHTIPAATAPVPEKPFLPRQIRRLPRIDSVDDSEARAAVQSTVSALSHCRDLGIPALALTPPSLPHESDLPALLNRQQQWLQERLRCEKAITPGDVESSAGAEIRIRQEREEYQRFLKVWHKRLLPLPQRQDACFRFLDRILDEADRCDVVILLRESSQPWTPFSRSGLGEIFQTFSGAPMKSLLDPAAEAWSRELLANELEAVSPHPEPGPAGLILGDYDTEGRETLPGMGLFPPQSLFFDEEAALTCPLHILDPAPGVSPDQVLETVSECRNLGIDGAPPPEPGEPWIIF